MFVFFTSVFIYLFFNESGYAEMENFNTKASHLAPTSSDIWLSVYANV